MGITRKGTKKEQPLRQEKEIGSGQLCWMLLTAISMRTEKCPLYLSSCICPFKGVFSVQLKGKVQKPDCTELTSKWKVRKRRLHVQTNFLTNFPLTSLTLYFPDSSKYLAAFFRSSLLSYPLLTFKCWSSSEFRSSIAVPSLPPKSFSYHMWASGSQILHWIFVSDLPSEL